MFVLKKSSYRKGIFAEIYAALFLSLKGYRVLKWRYKTKLGEVDLVFKKGKKIVFVEVKYRKQKIDALEAVTSKTKKRIINASSYFFQKNPQYEGLEMRFDVVSVYSYATISHIKQAWIS